MLRLILVPNSPLSWCLLVAVQVPVPANARTLQPRATLNPKPLTLTLGKVREGGRRRGCISVSMKGVKAGAHKSVRRGINSTNVRTGSAQLR